MRAIFLFFLVSTISGLSQTENEVVNMTARICQTDSMSKVLQVLDEDSVVTYHMQTPDYETYGASTYEYEDFNLVFDVSSNLLFNSTPFGKINVVKYSKKSCQLVIELAGVGDREKKGLWTFAVYEFTRPKDGKWLLQGINYHFDDFYSGKKLD
ncbi:MAG: hypothetical protein H6598_08470 [Flavobacteriales bacterium]|nr:hypothetical protein [Flavobacteriales bacterium]MCB9196244.1 hypothetical protein [Flavobacteriales bacterium]